MSHRFDVAVLRNLVAAEIASQGWKVEVRTVASGAITSLRSGVICASRGRAKVLVEIPPASTSISDVVARQAQHDKSRLRCLWLFSRPDFPLSPGLPAAFVGRTIAGGYVARLPGNGIPSEGRSAQRETDWQQSLSLDELISAAFGGRFWYGTVREGRPATVRLDGEFTKCDACGEWTNLCRAIEVLSPYPGSHFALYQLEDVPAHLLGELMPANLAASKVGPIRKRYIREERSSRTANSCIRCGTPQPGPELVGRGGQLSPITQFEIMVSKRLATATALLPAARWRVSPAADSGTAKGQ